jgi:hypothetical protein
MNLNRTCPACNETKELSEEYFNKVDSIPDAFEYYCKMCMERIHARIAEIEEGNMHHYHEHE